jgi:hypothetical protein
MSKNNCNTELNKIEGYQPARNAIESAKRWISKAEDNVNKTLNSEIDKFFSLYVSYNILYSLISNKNNGDRVKTNYCYYLLQIKF